MPFIGPKPADTVLDSTLIADGSITSAKIADGAIVNADLNNSAAIATSKITGLAASATTDTTNAANIASGTIADARISATSVQQHATSFDDNKILNDISTLGLRVHTQENLNASNSNSASFDVFQDSSAISNLTNVSRNASEFISSVATVTSSSNVGGSDTNFGDGNLRWSSTGANRDIYGTGNDIGYDGTSFNYNQLSSSDGSDASHTPDSSDALIVGNGKIWFDGVSHNAGGSATGTNQDYYEWGLLTNFSGVENTSPTVHSSGSNIAGIICATGGQQQNIRVLKVTGGNTVTLLGTIDASEIPSASSVITMARKDGRIYVLIADVLKFTVSQSDFDNTSNLAAIWSWGRGSGSARTYNNAGYRANMTEIKGLSTTTANATGSFTGNNITASSTNKMGAVITYQDNAGTNALNTDIVLQLSADNGSNYSTATMTALPDFATGIKMAKVNDLSVTAGTQLKYKISFANQASGSKEARIRGVSLQY
jgi:hypothetical protein